jgi:hypothetical protein
VDDLAITALLALGFLVGLVVTFAALATLAAISAEFVWLTSRAPASWEDACALGSAENRASQWLLSSRASCWDC